MKTTTAVKLLFVSVGVLLSAAASKAGTQEGLLSSYGFTVDMSVFEFGNGNVQLNNGSSIVGTTGVEGNEQVQLNNGSTIMTLVLPSPFTGNLQLQAQNGSSILHITSANLTPDVAAAEAASASFAGMAATSTIPGNQINLNNHQDLTITDLSTSIDVLHLSNLSLNNASELTLSGGANAKIVIDCTQMQLNNGSEIELTGGLTASDVVFNVTGHGDIQVNNGSKLEGTLLAINGNVQMNNGSNAIVGAVISSGLQLNNGSSIVSPEF